jgi:hypothetical protein
VNKKPKNRSKKSKDTQYHISSKPHSTKLGKPFTYQNPRPPKPTTDAHRQPKQNKTKQTSKQAQTPYLQLQNNFQLKKNYYYYY